MLHDLVWFFTTGRFDPVWAQAIASSVLVVLSLTTLIVLFAYAWDTHSLAKSSKLSADAAMKGAETALAQTKALIDKERARVFVVPFEEPVFLISLRKNVASFSHRFTFFNVGPTPAINIRVQYRAVLTEFETEATGEMLSRAVLPEVIAANDEVNSPLRVESGLDGRIPLGCYLHVWGEVFYNDVISPLERKTRFRYRVPMRATQTEAQIGASGDWIRFGPEADNSAT